jgi:SAM-dependent methyltransferase
MKNEEIIDYTSITESPGLKATKEQISRLYQRYHFARRFAGGKDVLEVACGSGIGLCYLAEVARSVTGGDIDERNVAAAGGYCRDGLNITVEGMDAQKLRFPDGSFDLVLLFEAIYYIKEPQRFIAEAERILRNKGFLIICTVNRDWEDFHPSPYSRRYFSAPELYEILGKRFNDVKLYGGFPVEKAGVRDRLVSSIKRAAVGLNLIPGSLEARAHLKRIFMGRLSALPETITEGMAAYEPPVQIAAEGANRHFKIIYALAVKG